MVVYPNPLQNGLQGIILLVMKGLTHRKRQG